MDVIGIGTPVKDLLVAIEEMPPQDSATRLTGISSQGGGKVSSAMVAAARLGIKAGMAGVIGDDKNGEFIRNDFVRHGVDTQNLITDPGTTSPFCLSIAESKSRTRRFFGLPSTCRKLDQKDIDYDYLKKASVIHLDSGTPVSISAAKFAKEHKITVSLDADHFREDLADITPLVDIFIGSEFYYQSLFGNLDHQTGCRRIAEQGCRVVIFTRGKQGCVGLINDQYFTLPIFQVPKVIDTTGAGDVFHGAYISAMVKGLDLVECARFASAVSAIKCTRLGGRAGIPDWDTTIHFMKTGEILESDLEERELYYRNLVW